MEKNGETQMSDWECQVCRRSTEKSSGENTAEGHERVGEDGYPRREGEAMRSRWRTENRPTVSPRSEGFFSQNLS